jgi:hypothetical protein
MCTTKWRRDGDQKSLFSGVIQSCAGEIFSQEMAAEKAKAPDSGAGRGASGFSKSLR